MYIQNNDIEFIKMTQTQRKFIWIEFDLINILSESPIFIFIHVTLKMNKMK